MNVFKQLLSLLLVGTIFFSCNDKVQQAKAESAQVKKPNIIYILADDLGYAEVGAYGQEKIETPNIDALARGGIRFKQAYAGGPVCTSSRSVLMTGLHNHATGHYGHAHGYNHFSTFESVKSLPVMLNLRILILDLSVSFAALSTSSGTVRY